MSRALTNDTDAVLAKARAVLEHSREQTDYVRRLLEWHDARLLPEAENQQRLLIASATLQEPSHARSRRRDRSNALCSIRSTALVGRAGS